MASKQALAKAFDAGQAAQVHGVSDDACPFAPDTDEYAAYMDGKSATVAEKWQVRGGVRHTMEVAN